MAEENQTTRVLEPLCLSWRNLIFNRDLQGARPATSILSPNMGQPIYEKLTNTLKMICLRASYSSNYVIITESVSVKGYVYIKTCCVFVTSSLYRTPSHMMVFTSKFFYPSP